MISDSARRVMRRKAGEGRPPPEVGVMTPARAWKIALPMAAEKAVRMIASVKSVNEDRVLRESLSQDLDDGTLLVLLEGPSDRYGVAFLDAQVLAAVVEALTSGQISSRQADARTPTPTDAMLCADLLDNLLEEFETSIEEMSEPPNVAGYRYAAPLADGRAIEMTLPDGPYFVYRLKLDLGSGAKTGVLTVALPAAARGAGARPDNAEFSRALEESIMGAPTQVEAVLHRVRLPISQVQEWQVGDVVGVPLAALASVALETVGRAPVATARLGQQGGFRAILITGVGENGARSSDEAFEDAVPASARAALSAMGALEGGLGGMGSLDLDLGDTGDSGLDLGGDLPDLGTHFSAGDGEIGELPDLADLDFPQVD